MITALFLSQRLNHKPVWSKWTESVPQQARTLTHTHRQLHTHFQNLLTGLVHFWEGETVTLQIFTRHDGNSDTRLTATLLGFITKQ